MNSRDWRRLLIIDERHQFNEKLTCNICHQLVVDPQECEICQTLFCIDCISKVMMYLNGVQVAVDKCPFNCKSVPQKIKPVNANTRAYLEHLKFRCTNYLIGCDQIIGYSQIQNHNNECDYQQICCKNYGCQETYPRYFQQQHKIECSFRPKNSDQTQYNSQAQQGFNSLEKQYQYSFQQLESEKRVLKIKNENLKHKYMMISDQLTQSQDRVLILEEQIKDPTNNQTVFSQKYKCPLNQNHQLEWINPKYGKCHECYIFANLRYCCNICNIKFCAKCKIPEIINMECIQGHKLKLKYKAKRDELCDLCDKKFSSFQTQGFYQDNICNLDICISCFEAKIFQQYTQFK